MRTFGIAMLMLCCCSLQAAAQPHTLEFRNGRVSLHVQDVPVAAVLAEWSRRGATQIVNAEHLAPARVTLELVDVPEAEALDILLGAAAGYVALRRQHRDAGASAYDRIFILAARPAVTPSAAEPPVIQREKGGYAEAELLRLLREVLPPDQVPARLSEQPAVPGP